MVEPKPEPELEAQPEPVPGRPRVVAAAVGPARRDGVIAKLNRVVAGGGTALLVTAEAGDRPDGLSTGVETLDLLAAERRLVLNRLLSRASAWPRIVESKPYRLLRPWLLWRALRRELGRVRVDELDHVIIIHQNSWPIAWQLHRLNERVTISYELPDVIFERAGRPVPPVLESEPAG